MKNTLIIPRQIHDEIIKLRKSEQKTDLSSGIYTNLEILERIIFDIVYSYNHNGGKQEKNKGYSILYKEYSEYLGSESLAEKNIANAVYNGDYQVSDDMFNDAFYKIVTTEGLLGWLYDDVLTTEGKQLVLLNNSYGWVEMDYEYEEDMLFEKRELQYMNRHMFQCNLNPSSSGRNYIEKVPVKLIEVRKDSIQ